MALGEGKGDAVKILFDLVDTYDLGGPTLFQIAKPVTAKTEEQIAEAEVAKAPAAIKKFAPSLDERHKQGLGRREQEAARQEGSAPTRPFGVNRAFLSTFIRDSPDRVLTFRQHQLPLSGPDEQPVETLHLGPILFR